MSKVFYHAWFITIGCELKNGSFGKRVSILSNESYLQLQQVNFNQMFGVRQRYCIRASLFWQDLSFGTKHFISAPFILYTRQGISISGIRFHFTKYIIFLIFKKINLIHHNLIRVPSAYAL